MMFMIPMPPTMSEIEAMPASRRVSSAGDRLDGLEQLRLVERPEVVRSRRWRCRGAAARRRGDARLGRSICVGVGDADADRPHRVAARRSSLWTAPTGTRTLSSWLRKPEPPFGCRMPTTRKGMPPMRDRRVPMALAPRPRSSAVEAPRTATRRSLLDAVGQEACPARRSRCAPRRSRGGADDAWSWCSRRRPPRAAASCSSGATPATPSRCARWPSASPSVRVVAGRRRRACRR